MCSINQYSNNNHNFNNNNTSHRFKGFLSFLHKCAILRMSSRKQLLLVNLETTVTVIGSSISLIRSFLMIQKLQYKRRIFQCLKQVLFLVSMQPKIILRCNNNNNNNIQFNTANNLSSNNIKNLLILILYYHNYNNNRLCQKKTEQLYLLISTSNRHNLTKVSNYNSLQNWFKITNQSKGINNKCLLSLLLKKAITINIMLPLQLVKKYMIKVAILIISTLLSKRMIAAIQLRISMIISQFFSNEVIQLIR